MRNKSSKSSNFSHTKLFTKRLENWSIRSGSVRCQPINRHWDYQQQKIIVVGYNFLQKHSFSSQPISRLFPHSIFSHSIYPRRHLWLRGLFWPVQTASLSTNFVDSDGVVFGTSFFQCRGWINLQGRDLLSSWNRVNTCSIFMLVVVKSIQWERRRQADVNWAIPGI